MEISYERLKETQPILLWALERSWTADHAAGVGCKLTANENSAWLVLEGRSIVRHDGDEHAAVAGEWIFPRPGEREQRFEGPFRFLSVTINWQWPDGRHLFDRGLTRVAGVGDLPWLEAEARGIIEETGALTKTSSYYLGLGELSLSHAARLFELGARWAASFERAMRDLGVPPDLGLLGDPRIEEALRSIAGMPPDEPLDRDSISARVGLSVRQLDRLLKQSTGRTLGEYHDGIRFDAASRKLLEPGIRIKEVASSFGFSDLASFSRWFSRRSGRSPRDFRANFGCGE